MNKTKRVIFNAVTVVIAFVGVLNVIDSIYAASIVDAANGNLTMSATINPSSTVSVSTTSIELDVVPSANGTFKKSDALVVNTYTNTSNACTVTMIASSASLTSSTDTPIASIGSSVSEANFNSQDATKDKWGYQVETGNFNPVAAGSNAVTTISSNTGNTGTPTNVYFATKLTQATKPGDYTNTVTFASTCANS